MGLTLTERLKKYVQYELIRKDTSVCKQLKDVNPERRGILLWISDEKEILKSSGVAGGSKGWIGFTAGWDSHCDCIPKYRLFGTKADHKLSSSDMKIWEKIVLPQVHWVNYLLGIVWYYWQCIYHQKSPNIGQTVTRTIHHLIFPPEHLWKEKELRAGEGGKQWYAFRSLREVTIDCNEINNLIVGFIFLIF